MIKLANRHPRVNILQPGPGVGGHCIAVDPWFIVDSAPDEAKLIRTARLVNDMKPNFVLDKIDHAVNSIGRKKSELTIACLGLAFKPDIDDLRESPALNIAKQISLMKFNEVLLVEPNISKAPKEFKAGTKITLINEALKVADIVVLLVDHIQFKTMDLNLLSGKQIVDTRGIWS
jgi:UDP-N-acetyl-D-mannosaminuronic acid dehydrogenase